MFRDVSFSRQSVSSPTLVILVLPKLSLIGANAELDEEGKRRYKFVADVLDTWANACVPISNSASLCS